MTPSEIEELINELETRVDRLRALYEQYFMGIEKMEPQVPRKDVERRIQLIRREQIRNTALRFRFQMILQRYNTYQTYWLRICREIEEGTYKRDVLRAKAKFGEAATRQLPKWHRRRFWKKDGEKKSDAPAEGADAPGALEFDESELEDAFDSVVMTPPPPRPPPPPPPPAGPPPPPPAPAAAAQAADTAGSVPAGRSCGAAAAQAADIARAIQADRARCRARRGVGRRDQRGAHARARATPRREESGPAKYGRRRRSAQACRGTQVRCCGAGRRQAGCGCGCGEGRAPFG